MPNTWSLVNGSSNDSEAAMEFRKTLRGLNLVRFVKFEFKSNFSSHLVLVLLFARLATQIGPEGFNLSKGNEK